MMIAPLVAEVVVPEAVKEFGGGGGPGPRGDPRLISDDRELVELMPMFMDVINRANSC